MTKCEDNEFPCIDITYDKVDSVCARELASPVLADTIVNKSEFCTTVPITSDFILDGLKFGDYLKGLSRKMGIYHLWIDYDDCDDHERYTMECIYVGKGVAEIRVTDHIKKKLQTLDAIHVSFYECENRIAKYLEQLFLDTYDFYLNSAENTGEGALYAVWDEERHHMGSEMHAVANIHAKKLGDGPFKF